MDCHPISGALKDPSNSACQTQHLGLLRKRNLLRFRLALVSWLILPEAGWSQGFVLLVVEHLGLARKGGLVEFRQKV